MRCEEAKRTDVETERHLSLLMSSRYKIYDDQLLHFIASKAVGAGVVWQALDYKYSSAIDYYENKPGLL